MREMERIPAELFFDPGLEIDMEKSIITAADGRVWVDVLIGPPEAIERIDAGEINVGLEAWGIRLPN